MGLRFICKNANGDMVCVPEEKIHDWQEAQDKAERAKTKGQTGAVRHFGQRLKAKCQQAFREVCF